MQGWFSGCDCLVIGSFYPNSLWLRSFVLMIKYPSCIAARSVAISNTSRDLDLNIFRKSEIKP